jgi:hypothetical protein
MEIELFSANNRDEWNNFCLQSNDAWFRHTTYWMDYIMCCRFDSNSKNHSFLMRQNKEIIAVIPLISQYCYADRTLDEFANYDTPTPYWALKNDCVNINKNELVKSIQNEIENIARVNNIKRRHFFIDPLINNNYLEEFKNYNLLKYNYKIKTTNIIDLTLSEENILGAMRKGHKSDIKRALKDKDLQIDYVDKTSDKINNFFIEYKKMHITDAGRQTRTDTSWACMLDWIHDGNALLILAKSRSLGKYISGAFIPIYKNAAYYGSYATINANLNNAIVGHLIQWYIIQYLKNRGVKRYETGWNYYVSSFDKGSCDQKLMQISEFKRGFGGKEKILIEFISDHI